MRLLLPQTEPTPCWGRAWPWLTGQQRSHCGIVPGNLLKIHPLQFANNLPQGCEERCSQSSVSRKRFTAKSPREEGAGRRCWLRPLQGPGARDNAQKAGAAQARAWQPWAELCPPAISPPHCIVSGRGNYIKGPDPLLRRRQKG